MLQLHWQERSPRKEKKISCPCILLSAERQALIESGWLGQKSVSRSAFFPAAKKSKASEARDKMKNVSRQKNENKKIQEKRGCSFSQDKPVKKDRGTNL
jgi:hypothetical protein